MLYVSGSVRSEFRFHVYPKGLGQAVINVYEKLAAPIGYVESLAGSLMRRETRLQIRFYYILYICKVATLTAIAVNTTFSPCSNCLINFGITAA